MRTAPTMFTVMAKRPLTRLLMPGVAPDACPLSPVSLACDTAASNEGPEAAFSVLMQPASLALTH